MRLFFGILLIAGLAFSSFGDPQAGGRPPGNDGPKCVPLFTAAGAERVGASPIAPQASRYRAVTVNPVLSEAGGIAVGDRLFISAFDDGAVFATVDRVETDVNGVLAVRARIPGSEGYLLFASDKGRVLAQLVLPEQRREYEISCEGGGTTHIVQEFAPGARVALDDSPPLIPPASADPSPPMPPMSLLPAAATRIDTMIVYTASARDYANASSGINTFISLAMQKGQLGMDNSLTDITLRLVHSALVNYTESGSSDTDLNRLTSTNDGYMDEVHTWRNTYGADLVHLFTNVEDTGGLGWLLNSTSGQPAWAFCLGRIKQVSWTFTTVHEWGHNMGCHHRKNQATQPGPGLFSYSAGWRWIGSDSGKYCSIMSYQDEWSGVAPTQVGYFSSPNVSYMGTATGHAADGDNARTLREIKAVISGYRAEGSTNTLTIAASSGGTTNPVPGSYSYSPGTNVAITATPAQYCVFLGWSGDASGTTSPITVTMDRDKSVTASFKLVSPPSNLAAVRLTNRSLTQTEYVVDLSWTANTANSGLNIVVYRVYKKVGEDWISLNDNTPSNLTYRVRMALKGEQTFGISSVNQGGVESAKVTILK